MQKHSGIILINPRITEKGAYLAESGCYVFNVAKEANKFEIAHAVRTIYKVTPRAIRIAKVPRKETNVRGSNRKGMTAGGKKAYVYLKKGEKIELS
jgi:large subunit ribosomal protein L23